MVLIPPSKQVFLLFLSSVQLSLTMSANLIPADIWSVIFSFLPSRDVIRIGRVCKTFLELVQEEALWKRKAFIDFNITDLISDSWHASYLYRFVRAPVQLY